MVVQSDQARFVSRRFRRRGPGFTLIELVAVIAMVAIYFESHRLPVRFPIYIAIVALARYLILDSKTMGPLGLVAVGGTVVLLTLAVLVLRYGHVKFPYSE